MLHGFDKIKVTNKRPVNPKVGLQAAYSCFKQTMLSLQAVLSVFKRVYRPHQSGL
ncbi:MAG: hypothetical protein KA221_05445 [Vitreoscilla sp.]|nr:hypothetical protein [Vitreoscilla sp.]MBP9540592.1 hypothetical protein [Vitreoscilla sp.]